jgi:hypothetical protein
MPGLINEGAKWAYPDMKTFRKRLRELAESRRIYKKDAETLGEHIRNTFTKENIFQKIVDSSNDVTKTSEIDTDDLDKKSLQAIHHTTVMMNLGNQIKNISEKQK